jgi:hypothetical protein
MAKTPTYKTSEQLLRDRMDKSSRVAQVARDDKYGNINVGLMEMDSAIKYYFDNVIKPIVQENNQVTKVPVIYGSPERWKSVQRDGYYRDEKRKIMTPLIMFRRTGMENRRDLARNLDANNPQIYQDFHTKYSPRNRYTPFSRLNNEIPEREIFNVIVPNYVTLAYECIIWTDYTAQMNDLIEAINFSDSAYWGEPDKFKFYSVINSFTPSTELSDGEDRLIRTTFDISLNGYIIPNSVQKSLAQKSEKGINITKVVFDISTDQWAAMQTGSDDPRSMRAVFNELSYTPPPVVGSGYHISTDIVNYLNSNTELIADTVTADTATWSGASFQVAPGDLPATSIDNFIIYFGGGTLIAHSDIISFNRVGLDVVMVVNTGSLGYEITGGPVWGYGPWL